MKVMIGTPTFDGAKPTFMNAIFEVAAKVRAVGLECMLQQLSESLITRARTRILARFLEDKSYTHLFFHDADVGSTPEAFIKLLLADRDVVAGVYPLKRYDWPQEGLPAGCTLEQFEVLCTRYPLNIVNGNLKSDQFGFGCATDGGILEAPTGFMCIKRAVFERMMEAYPLLNYEPEGEPERTPFHWLFFDTMLETRSRRFLSEDYAFCHRWHALGGKVWVDLHSKLTHEGRMVFRGDLIAHLRAGTVQ